MCVHVLMCNFVSYFVCVILCIFVFLCDILLPSGAINDDEYCAGTGRDGNETLRVWVEMEIKYTGWGWVQFLSPCTSLGLTSNKSDPGSNPDFRINPDSDPDICWISPKSLWIH